MELYEIPYMYVFAIKNVLLAYTYLTIVIFHLVDLFHKPFLLFPVMSSLYLTFTHTWIVFRCKFLQNCVQQPNRHNLFERIDNVTMK